MAGRLAEPLLPVDASSRDLEACASAPVAAPMQRLTGTFEDGGSSTGGGVRRAGIPRRISRACGATGGGYCRTWNCMWHVARHYLPDRHSCLCADAHLSRLSSPVHRDAHTAQKLGSASWTIGLVILVLIDSIDGILHLVQQEPSSLCPSVSAAVPALTALFCFSLAMLNGTLGMSFLHKTGLLALLSVDALIAAWACSGSPNYALELGVSVASSLLGYATAHDRESAYCTG